MFRLCISHFTLTNDIYSYDKEILERKEEATAAFNAAYVLQVLLNVSATSSRVILCQIIFNLEDQLHASYEAHVQANALNRWQLRYTGPMIERLAGNLFYSSTISRYARVFPFCHLQNTSNVENAM